MVSFTDGSPRDRFVPFFMSEPVKLDAAQLEENPQKVDYQHAFFMLVANYAYLSARGWEPTKAWEESRRLADITWQLDQDQQAQLADLISIFANNKFLITEIMKNGRLRKVTVRWDSDDKFPVVV